MSSLEETVLNLLDSYWFEYGVFTAKPSLSSTVKPAPAQQPQQEDPIVKPKLNKIPITLLKKSMSDQFLSSKDSSDSPKSVLCKPRLQSILSGKETESFENSAPRKQQPSMRVQLQADSISKRKMKKSSSKSLSELEYEELKGFMDLGFVFSDEDRDSRLVHIIPGLQRLDHNKEPFREVLSSSSSSVCRRPYLSEAWEHDEKIRSVKMVKNNPVVDCRIPAFGNEMELKDHLRFWAHTVASTVV